MYPTQKGTISYHLGHIVKLNVSSTGFVPSYNVT